MTPPAPVHDVRIAGTQRVVHLDRRRLVLLGLATAFLVIAVLFAGQHPRLGNVTRCPAAYRAGL
jgi:hypothetical protein